MENIQDFNSFINSQSPLTENNTWNDMENRYDLTFSQMYRFVSIGNWIYDEGFATPTRVEDDSIIKKLEQKGLFKIDGNKVYFTDLGRTEFDNIPNNE